MSRSDIFSIPSYHQYNGSITLARIALSFYVLFSNSVFWYDYHFHDINPFLRFINLCFYNLFKRPGDINLAVIAFITISGYCVHRQGMRLADWNVKQFLLHRFFRIYPLLLLATILSAVVYYQLASNAKIVTITATQHISLGAIIYKLSGLFAFVPNTPIDLVYLGNGLLIVPAVECWLYIFYPIMGFMVLKCGDKLLWTFLASVTLIGAIAYTLSPELAKWWHTGSFFGLLAYWWIGIYAVSRDSRIFKYAKQIICLYVAITLLMMLYPNLFLGVEIRKILFSLLIGAGMRWVENKQITNLPMRSLFESGYSLYALHTPLICLALVHNFNFYVMVISILILAYVSYISFERPLSNLGRAIGKQFPAHGYAVAGNYR